MADQSPIAEMHSGADGNLSGRRLLGTGLIIGGFILLSVGQFQGGDWAGRIAPGGIAILGGFLMWGIVTAQNIVDAVRK